MDTPPEVKLKRFLHFLSEDGRYEPRPKQPADFDPSKLTAVNILSEIDPTGTEIILPIILEAYENGLSVEPNAIIVALVVCAIHGTHEELRKNAFKTVRSMNLDHRSFIFFCSLCIKHSKNKGGKGLARTVAKWYESKSAKELADIVAFSNKVNRLRHSDLVALFHLKSDDIVKEVVFSYIMSGYEKTAEKFALAPETHEMLQFLKVAHEIKNLKDPVTAADLLKIHCHKMPPESFPPALMKAPEVWEAIFPSMTIDQVLGKTQHLFKLKFLKPSCSVVSLYTDKLTNIDLIQASSIDPTQVLVTLRTYEGLPQLKELFKAKLAQGLPGPIQIAAGVHQLNLTYERKQKSNGSNGGSGTSGSTSGVPRYVPPFVRDKKAKEEKEKMEKEEKKKEKERVFKLCDRVRDSLSHLYEKSFSTLRSTNLRYLIAVDVRGPVKNSFFVKCPFVKSIEAAACLTQCFLNAENEDSVSVVRFHEAEMTNMSEYKIKEVAGLSSSQTLEEIEEVLTNGTTGGPVNVLKLFDWAIEHNKSFDVFIILSHTTIIPCEPYNAIVQYSDKSGIKNPKLITVTLNGTCKRSRKFHKKPNMLYINGFNHKTWRVMRAFCLGAF